MLVVAEDHQLREVQEAAELRVREADVVHAVVLLEHAAVVVGHLHLNENQRQSVDEQRDVRAEAVAAVLAGHLRDALPDVVLGRVVVDDLIGLIREYLLVELAPQVLIVEHHADLADKQGYLLVCQIRVELAELTGEGVCIDVGLGVEMQAVERAIGIAYSREMRQCGQLHPDIFIESCHIPNL